MGKTYYYFIIALLIALTLIVSADFSMAERETEIIFLDVGQGDSLLIQRGSTQILIDGGPGATVIEKLGQYMPYWDRQIEM
ncbi:hypothetical protein ACFL2B_03345, partial [Patescibacteria group bacterium]